MQENITVFVHSGVSVIYSVRDTKSDKSIFAINKIGFVILGIARALYLIFAYREYLCDTLAVYLYFK